MMSSQSKRERIAPLRIVKSEDMPALSLANDRAELALIGSVFHQPDLYPALADMVQPADFFSLTRGWVWWAIEQVYPNVDNLTVAEALKGKIPDQEGLDRLINTAIVETPDIQNAETYARLVRESAVRIRIFNATENMRQALFGEASLDAQIDACNTLLFQASEQYAGQMDTSAMAIMQELWNGMDSGQGAGRGCPTGFRRLDEMLQRIYIGEIALLVGHPGMGKTAVLLSIIRNVLNAGRRVVMFSLDNMPKVDMGRILMGMETGIHKSALLENRLTPDQHRLFAQAAGKISEWKLDVIDEYTALTPTQLRRRLRRLFRDHGEIDLVVVDGLWLMRADEPTGDRPIDLHMITHALMDMARQEFGVPMLIAHQYNQDAKGRSNKKPIINDVAESAAVQRNIPLILGMYRETYYDRDSTNDITQLYVLKDRKRGKQGESVDFIYDRGAYVEPNFTVDLGSKS